MLCVERDRFVHFLCVPFLLRLCLLRECTKTDTAGSNRLDLANQLLSSNPTNISAIQVVNFIFVKNKNLQSMTFILDYIDSNKRHSPFLIKTHIF
jgi:hypothetical protein